MGHSLGGLRGCASPFKKIGLKKLADAGEAGIREVCSRMTPDAVLQLLAGVKIGLRIAELQTESCEES